MQPMIERQQDIEHGDDGGQAGLNILTDAVMDALEITDDGDHRERGFHKHAFIPGAFGTHFAIVGNAVDTAEAIVGQGNASLVHALNHVVKVLIVDIHGIPIPLHDLPVAIKYPAQLDADAPASFILTVTTQQAIAFGEHGSFGWKSSGSTWNGSW